MLRILPYFRINTNVSQQANERRVSHSQIISCNNKKLLVFDRSNCFRFFRYTFSYRYRHDKSFSCAASHRRFFCDTFSGNKFQIISTGLEYFYFWSDVIWQAKIAWNKYNVMSAWFSNEKIYCGSKYLSET